MDRLEETQLGPFASLKDKAEAKPGAFHDYDCLYAHMAAVTRLKAYEDTGLEPEEIKQMCALARLNSNIFDNDFGNHIAELIVAERDGRLVLFDEAAARAEKAEAENQSLKSAISQYCKNDCYRDSCNGNEDVGIPDCPFAIYSPLPELQKG